MPCRSDRARLAAIGVVIVALATLPGQALGAKLIGGRRQAAVTKSFSALHAHKGELIVSIRASTVSPSWVVVESVRPEHSARTSPQQTSIRLRSTYFHRAGTVERRAKTLYIHDYDTLRTLASAPPKLPQDEPAKPASE